MAALLRLKSCSIYDRHPAAYLYAVYLSDYLQDAAKCGPRFHFGEILDVCGIV